MALPITFMFLGTTSFSGKNDYVGGWGFQVNYSSYMFPHQATRLPGYGAAFKERVRKMQPGYLSFGSLGKVTSDYQELCGGRSGPRRRAWHSDSCRAFSLQRE